MPEVRECKLSVHSEAVPRYVQAYAARRRRFRSRFKPGGRSGACVEALKREDCRLILVLDEVHTYLNEGRDPKIFYILNVISYT